MFIGRAQSLSELSFYPVLPTYLENVKRSDVTINHTSNNVKCMVQQPFPLYTTLDGAKPDHSHS